MSSPFSSRVPAYGAEAGKKSLKLTELEEKGDLDAAEKIVDEMKQESKLIWSEQEERNTASSMLK